MPRTSRFFEEIARNMANSEAMMTNLPPSPFLVPQTATITDVADPLLQGRVKVSLSSEKGLQTDWLYVTSSPRGQLSKDFIGKKVLVVAESGDPNKLVVVGFLGGPDAIGSPVNVPTVSVASREIDNVPCDETTLGHLVLFEEFSGSALRVCRRTDSGIYAWMGTATPQMQATTEFSDTKSWSQYDTPRTAVGEVFAKKTCRRGLVETFINDYDEKGRIRSRPTFSAPVHTRATSPECNEQRHGQIIVMSTSKDDSYAAVCVKKYGNHQWIEIGAGRPTIGYKTPFKDTEELTETFSSKFSECEINDDLRDEELDQLMRSPEQKIAQVQDIESQENLTVYLNGDSFTSTLKDETGTHEADQATRLRQSAHKSQQFKKALELADNNLTALENMNLDRSNSILENLQEVLRKQTKCILLLRESLNSIAGVIGSSRSRERRTGRKEKATRLREVKQIVDNEVNPNTDTFIDKNQTIENYVKNTLEPGFPVGSREIPEVVNEISQKALDLHETIEKKTKLNTQIFSPQYNALKEEILNVNQKLNEVIGSFGDFPELFNSVAGFALDSGIDLKLVDKIKSYADKALKIISDPSSILSEIREFVPESIQAYYDVLSSGDISSLDFSSIPELQPYIDAINNTSASPIELAGILLSGTDSNDSKILGQIINAGTSGDLSSIAEICSELFFSTKNSETNIREYISNYFSSDENILSFAQDWFFSQVSSDFLKQLPDFTEVDTVTKFSELFRENLLTKISNGQETSL